MQGVTWRLLRPLRDFYIWATDEHMYVYMRDRCVCVCVCVPMNVYLCVYVPMNVCLCVCVFVPIIALYECGIVPAPRRQEVWRCGKGGLY
jgi:hypothetical protein